MLTAFDTVFLFLLLLRDFSQFVVPVKMNLTAECAIPHALKLV